MLIRTGCGRKLLVSYSKNFYFFFNPKLHQLIDFDAERTFLDKELYQEVIDNQKGKRYADRLVKVRLKNGQEKWILVHVEVQGSKEDDFSKRMFQYFYRIYDRYEEEIAAIAVHTFPRNIKKMKKFQYDFVGTQLNYSYNNYKTEDFSNEELESSDNVFSKVILAAKAVHATKNEGEKRY